MSSQKSFRRRHVRSLIVAATISLTVLPAMGQGNPPPDPYGILRKPIPDKFVVLTFDDGPASHATIVAPILKKLGFGGSFYVCDFDSFATRKDWYMTWRQMKALAAEGFEVGNHTKGHAGGSGMGPYLAMEDELLANGVPKPATIAWPMYQVNPRTFSDLAANGYVFGRGGHFRPYRPTVDNPFDVPSMCCDNVESLVKCVRQATGGRIVVMTFHGVPDMEHPAVGIEPATFKAMMQYLKDNHYKAIAMRDLAEYIDPAKAAKLPPTANAVKETSPAGLATQEKPCAAGDIQAFAFPGVANARICGSCITATVAYATDVTALKPDIRVSEGASVAPASGVARDFTRPQTYTVTARDGATRTYTVTVERKAASSAKDVLTFALPGSACVVVAGDNVGVYVAPATDVTKLAPTFTLSLFATAAPTSGTAMDFTRPQKYTITAQDGSSRVCTVTVGKSDKPTAFTWRAAATGNWSDGARWLSSPAEGLAPATAGRPEYVLNFDKPGNYTVTNDLKEAFELNHLSVGAASVKVKGMSIAFAANAATATGPRMDHGSPGEVSISAPLKLAADITVDVAEHGRVVLEGPVSGAGGMAKNGEGQLRITNRTNTYSGGTTINHGSLLLLAADNGLGKGPVTLSGDGSLDLENVTCTNPLILNGGTINAGNGFGDRWDGEITLNGNTQISSYADFVLNGKGGHMSGPGGFTHIGCRGGFGMVNWGTVSLCGTNTYTGPTIVRLGTLRILKAASLYNGDATNWTPRKITVHTAATLVVRAGGPGEFTGEQVAALLTNLTTGVDHNGLMAGAVFCVDTTNAKDAITIAADLADSRGPGGGAFVLRKRGPGALCLAGKNTWTGRTVIERGKLSVSSLNSVGGEKPSSSLGAPRDVESGEIVIGDGDGAAALVYTGTGETSGRAMNLAANNSTVTFDQSGGGLLKLTGEFIMSGFGHDKTIVLAGSSAGAGEIAGGIADPYDRAGKARTALTKTGTGTWALSGANTYTGATTVAEGTLAICSWRSLGPETDVTVAAGATLELNFKGQVRVGKLMLGGKVQAAGTYSAANALPFIKRPGSLVTR